MLIPSIAGGLAALSSCIGAWQFIVAHRFPLNRRFPVGASLPPVSILKPMKGADARTRECLESWLTQDYPAAFEVVMGMAEETDPAFALAGELVGVHGADRARRVLSPEALGANGKVSNLSQIVPQSRHRILVISDADVWVPPDYLRQVVTQLQRDRAGLVHSFYRLVQGGGLAARLEVFAANADFWSQVLQARTLKPVDFALGAAMTLRRETLEAIGGFEALKDHLADDYHLGNRIATRGQSITLSPLVVECRGGDEAWPAVLAHQLRWARTIRVCQPAPYFMSILSNGTFWPLLWMLVSGSATVLLAGGILLLLRALWGIHQEARLEERAVRWADLWLPPVKDLVQVCLWMMAFAGNRIHWRGGEFIVAKDGTLTPNDPQPTRTR